MKSKSPWRQLIGESCWHVSAGGSTMPSFVLAFGKQVPRRYPLSNKAQPVRFRKYRGSIELLVWCSWRVQTDKVVLASSDQDEGGLKQLSSLRRGRIVDVTCYRPAWDLRLKFGDGRVLVVFCDRVNSENGPSENWEIWLPDGRKVTAGPGANIRVECLEASL